jgi:hypothetical protein
VNVTFHTPPNPTLLQKLAKGSLEQIQNLTRAVRLWVLLRWLYSDEGYVALLDSFTYTDWRKAFFPWSLRQDMTLELQQAWNLYR